MCNNFALFTLYYTYRGLLYQKDQKITTVLDKILGIFYNAVPKALDKKKDVFERSEKTILENKGAK